MPQFTPQTLPIGAMCTVPSRMPGLEHYGVCVGYDARGVATFVHNNEQGVHVTTWEGFTGGLPVTIKSLPNDAVHGQVIAGRARTFIGQPYSLFLRNCEHVAREAVTGTPSSSQLQAAVVGTVVAGGLAWLWSTSDEPPKKKPSKAVPKKTATKKTTTRTSTKSKAKPPRKPTKKR